MKGQNNDFPLNTIENSPKQPPEAPKKQNKLLWTILFIAIAAASIWAVTSQNKDFSAKKFLSYLSNASPVWIFAAVLSMIAYIVVEAYAIIYLCRGLGYKCKWKNGFFYSASDIYFSAITPSATGGQPACAYFMVKDKVPGAVATVTLLLNVMMYTLSLVLTGIIIMIINPKTFFCFHPVSMILIAIGYILQLVLALLFYFVLYKKDFLHRICNNTLRLFGKIHLINNVEKKLAKLNKTMEEYHSYSNILKKQRRMIIKTLFLNVLQRFAQIAVTMFVFLATGGILGQALDIWSIQNFVVIGASCIPIPGAIGITDYLMLDGFGRLMEAQQATNLELLSRTLSFYSCIFICGISVIVKYYLLKRRSKT